jgi:hypothetical protein
LALALTKIRKAAIGPTTAAAADSDIQFQAVASTPSPSGVLKAVCGVDHSMEPNLLSQRL